MLRGVQPRLKKSVLLAFVLALSMLVFFTLNYVKPRDVLVKPVKLAQERNTFKNPIYDSWAKHTPLKSKLSRCDDYLNRLEKLLPHRTLPGFEEVRKTVFTPLLYKKKRWIAEEKKHYRRRLRDKGIRLNDGHMKILEKLYYDELRKLSLFEKGFIHDLNHLRTFGNCLTDEKCTILSDDAHSKSLTGKLLPWFLGSMPTVDRKLAMASTKSLLAQLKETLKGKGIVIPLFPHQEKSVQLRNTKSLIYVLRALQNKLPIEITYVGEKFINKATEDSLRNAAKDPLDVVPHSQVEYANLNGIANTLFEWPAQNISFVNLDPTLVNSLQVSDSLMLVLSNIFNSFEEVMMISPRTIPLKENLESLFENDGYKQHGTLFFKERSLLEFKPQKPPAGYYDVKQLINRYAGVNDYDKQFFGLHVPETQHTSWVREKGFTRLADPSFMLLNKTKTLPGLLISSALPFYGVLKPKYDFSGELNPEIMWLGQELSGTVQKVNFNSKFAVAAGVITPFSNREVSGSSQELCSSSWAQLSDVDDYTLIYVTSHQLDNGVLPKFREDLEQKYVESGAGANKLDHTLVQNTVAKNLLFIQSVLQTIPLEEPYPNMAGEQTKAWRHLNTFGLAKDYWCAYDIVGSALLPNRGLIIDYGKKVTSRYRFLFDLWEYGSKV